MTNIRAKPLPTIMSKIDKKEIIVSTVKSIFGTIPLGGAALDEIFFEYNGRIKQNRLNKFVEILEENFTKDSNISIEHIKTENFNDLFESVLRRVVQTKSKLKLERFKDILILELNNPSQETELIEVYLDLISTLSEEELIILSYHKDFNKNYDRDRDNLKELEKRMSKIKEDMRQETIIINKSKYQDDYDKVSIGIKELKKKNEKIEKYRNSDFYKISEQKFMFYKQRLFSKGLILDWGIGRIGIRPFEKMSITEFGNEFIEFIRSK